jgi:2-polyprenyl-6-methoxyphenol hydroxylase-like FAD-dependent oxidoreductase
MVLIGDAAHAFSPLLAQGATMAIEDAVALAESLGESGDIDQAPPSDESTRWPRAETIQAAVRHRSIARPGGTSHARTAISSRGGASHGPGVPADAAGSRRVPA